MSDGTPDHSSPVGAGGQSRFFGRGAALRQGGPGRAPPSSLRGRPEDYSGGVGEAPGTGSGPVGGPVAQACQATGVTQGG
jgi:hypothetical protein